MRENPHQVAKDHPHPMDFIHHNEPLGFIVYTLRRMSIKWMK